MHRNIFLFFQLTSLGICLARPQLDISGQIEDPFMSSENGQIDLNSNKRYKKSVENFQSFPNRFKRTPQLSGNEDMKVEKTEPENTIQQFSSSSNSETSGNKGMTMMNSTISNSENDLNQIKPADPPVLTQPRQLTSSSTEKAFKFQNDLTTMSVMSMSSSEPSSEITTTSSELTSSMMPSTGVEMMTSSMTMSTTTSSTEMPSTTKSPEREPKTLASQSNNNNSEKSGVGKMSVNLLLLIFSLVYTF